MSQDSRKMRVLVVEDDPAGAATLQMLLNLSGYDVQVARTGLEAIAMAENYQPDAILLDIGLPGLSGYEVAKRIRANSTGTPPFLIAVTGHGNKEDLERTKHAGIDLHLLKPVDPQELLKLLPHIEKIRSVDPGQAIVEGSS